jgi:DNA-binding MarR family transcriptional regulator/GNAT superfamily N-acetyltransferase
MSSEAVQDHVATIRAFNRFYTQKIGVLEEGLLNSPFSLTEVRVMYELAHGERLSAVDLGRTLGLDAGYLSRVLTRLDSLGFLARKPSAEDARRRELTLTEAGLAAYKPLERATEQQLAQLIETWPEAKRAQLIAAMETVRSLLGDAEPARVPYMIRPPHPGDYGWIVHRHGVLYAQEYGWDERFEALVARIIADYLHAHDPACERCWIAEREGAVVGSIFLVKENAEVGKLRLLYVEPDTRGLGIGRRLVEECIREARRVGYRKLVLWTNSILHSARRIYETSGFRLISEEPHTDFGENLVGQYWELDL